MRIPASRSFAGRITSTGGIRHDVRANPEGYYVASLSEQVSLGDPRIIVTMADAFHLCTRSAATPATDSTKAILLMRKRTVKYLLVSFTPPERDFGPASQGDGIGATRELSD